MNEESQPRGVLYIVGTPIGNLEDITLRALRILKEVDIIYCEDTRVTKKLLHRYDIQTPTKRLDGHTEEKQTETILASLKGGKSVAYVSDAGTPAISDPGYRMVGAVRAAKFRVETVPGPSSVTAALSIAGVSADTFLFLGFLPHKKGRRTLLREITETKRAIVLFESTHRIMRLLKEISEHMPGREVIIGRELTKKFEEVLSGSAIDILSQLEKAPEKQKGEFVVIIEPAS